MIPEAINKIINAVIVSFLFFLVIGVILSITLWRVLKTQMEEEQKRREATRALAHDIKTPLFIIAGYAQNLKENVNTDKREHYADKIIERTDEVSEIVHRMLDFTKLDFEHYQICEEEFEFSALLSETVARFQDVPDRKEIVLSTEETFVTADRELMRSVLLNLIDNAMKYAESDTQIDILLKDRVFSVSNVCTGIEKKDLSQLTEPYYRKDSSRNTTGNGLGLAVVKSILELHGTKLMISLKDNVISFSFKLP